MHTYFQKFLHLEKDTNKETCEWIENQDWDSFGTCTVDELQTAILRLEFILSKLTTTTATA